MSKWDWIHAGLEAAAYTEAQAARRNLEAMKTATEIETARRLLLEAMKNFVFDISRDIQLIEEQIPITPLQTYIVSKLLHLRFSNSGLSADIFPDFQDKEYVFKTQKKIVEVMDKSKVGLSSEQIQDAESTIKYIDEMPLLQKASSAKKAFELLETSEEKWEKLENAQKQKSSYIVFGVILVMITMTIASFSGSDEIMIFSCLGLIGVFAFLFTKASTSPEYKKLRNERESLQRKLLPQNEWQEVLATFGDLSSDQFQSILVQRESFLVEKLGNDNAQKFLHNSVSSQNEENPNENTAGEDTSENALENHIKKINSMKLEKPAEDYLNHGLAFSEKFEFDEAILEFVKVIRLTTPEDTAYQKAKKQLVEMGFSESDINQISKK